MGRPPGRPFLLLQCGWLPAARRFRESLAAERIRRVKRAPSALLLLGVVLAAGTGVRAVNWMQVADGSILYFHLWEQSDMNFFHEWARRIAAGDLVSAPRPYHRWHGEVAQEVFQRQHPGAAFDEAQGRALWDRWLGTAAYYQDPLYAYLLGASYRLLGPRVEPVLLAQAAMGLAIAALAFALGWMLDGRWTALGAGLMAALYAPLVFYEGTLLRGVLQALLSLALVAAAQQALRSRRPGGWWLAAGLAGGLLGMTHSTGLLLVAALAAVLAWRERGRRRWRSLLLYAAGACAALAPFAARNVSVGLPPLVSPAYGPVNFIISNAADRNPWVGFPISTYTDEILEATGGRLGPVVRATLATHDGPGSWLWLSLQKLLVFVNWRETVDNINFAYYLLQAPLVSRIGLRFALLAPLAVAGLVVAGCARLRESLPSLLGVGVGLLIAVVFFTSSRLRLSSALLLMPFGALALVEAVRRPPKRLLLAVAAGGAAAVLVLVSWAPTGPAVRDSDYTVGNVIALERARARAESGDVEAALRTLDVQLRTEPAELSGLQMREGDVVRLSEDGARAAAFFVDLHQMSAALHAMRGEREEAWQQERHARLLAMVATQYAARSR
jgi:dolichyl-phosphate-mannose-protein mannosyltransferase